jgi:hypothetical protein
MQGQRFFYLSLFPLIFLAYGLEIASAKSYECGYGQQDKIDSVFHTCAPLKARGAIVCLFVTIPPLARITTLFVTSNTVKKATTRPFSRFLREKGPLFSLAILAFFKSAQSLRRRRLGCDYSFDGAHFAFSISEILVSPNFFVWKGGGHGYDRLGYI